METQQLIPDIKQIAYCGLYCGSCQSYLKGKCKGCAKNDKASWCKIRTCCIENKYQSCAECKQYKEPMDCSKFNNLFSKFFALVFKSDRNACINMIKQSGYEGYALYMAQNRLQTIKKK